MCIRDRDGTAAQQVDSGCLLRTFFQQVKPLDDLLLGAGLEARHRVVLIEQRQVEEDVVLLLDHALQAMVQDHRHLVREGRVVADAVGNGAGQDVAVAVLVLQPFAVERGAPAGAPEQEATRLHVTGRPGQIADALEAEHRVVDVKRNHDAVVRRVRRRRGDPAAHAAGLVDAFLQDLAGLVLPVVPVSYTHLDVYKRQSVSVPAPPASMISTP